MINGILTVDPGMNTGWAFWSGLATRPIEYGQITARHKGLTEDLAFLFQRFGELRKAEWNFQRVVIEYPGLWGSSAASMASAASGDLIKLAAVVGGYAAIAVRDWTAEITLISPYLWMKQMSKDAVKLRVQRATGIEERSSHVNDAIGIGLHLRNKLTVPNESRPFSTKPSPFKKEVI